MKKSKREKLNAVTELTARIKKVKARCKYFGECGGCLLQDVTYPDQLALKRDLINATFARAGIALQLDAVAPSPTQWFYRNRMDYPVGEHGEIGLKPLGHWRDVLDLKECFLLSPETPEILQLVRDWMAAWQLPGWNNKNYSGYVRYVVMREGKNTHERMVMIVTADAAALSGAAPTADVWADLVKRLGGLATTIIHGVNARVTDISIPAELHVVHGPADFSERVNEYTFRIAPASFFQTNTSGAELLQREVRAQVHGARVLDLYCGLGFFSIDAAAHGKKVLGVEIDAAAIALAQKNATRNNVAAEFLAAPVEEWLKTGGDALVRAFAPDTIIIDPPRAGLHPRVLDWLVRGHEAHELVYVSCNYEQFAREFSTLARAYTLSSLSAIDMFPHTPHVELVARCVRRNVSV